MSWKNDSKYRNTKLTVRIRGELKGTFYITDEFEWDNITYPNLSSYEFSKLSDEDYEERLDAFYQYLEDYLKLSSGYLSGHSYQSSKTPYGENVESCPIGEGFDVIYTTEWEGYVCLGGYELVYSLEWLGKVCVLAELDYSTEWTDLVCILEPEEIYDPEWLGYTCIMIEELGGGESPPID